MKIAITAYNVSNDIARDSSLTNTTAYSLIITNVYFFYHWGVLMCS
jgi:hypothetical protein